MKKKVLSIAIIAVSLFSVSAVAQNPDDAQRPACMVEGCDQHHQNGPKAPRHRMSNPFEGLNLTDAQKEQIKELRKNNKEARQQKQADRQKNRNVSREKRDSLIKTGKLNHLRQLKEILTPEQYVTFLENIVVSQKPEGRNHRMAPGKGKHGKRGHVDCQARPDNCKSACDEKAKK